MSYNGARRSGKPPRYLILLLVLLPLAAPMANAADAASNGAADGQEAQPLEEAELQSLRSTLGELRQLAPKLRILLRTLRQQVGFDPREIHSIERGMSQSQQDLERMIAMHERDAFNRMRAHFMADDLRRKSEGLKASLAYVKRRISELDQAPGDRRDDAELKQNDDALVELLGLYSDLVSESVMLLQDKGI